MSTFNRNNQTLSSIPINVQLGKVWRPEGQSKLVKVHLRMDNLFLPGYDLVVKFNSKVDCRNKVRFSRTNGWLWGKNFWLYKDGKLVGGKENLKVRRYLYNRMLRSLDRDSLIGYPVTLAQFVLICSFPEIRLAGKHTHHINQFKFFHLFRGNMIDWFSATDDRVCNLECLAPEEHHHTHLINGDNKFFNYKNYNFVIKSIHPENFCYELIDFIKCDRTYAETSFQDFNDVNYNIMVNDFWLMVLEYGFLKPRNDESG